MDTQTEHTYRGGWAGPIAAVVLIAIALLLVGGLELGMVQTLVSKG